MKTRKAMNLACAAYTSYKVSKVAFWTTNYANILRHGGHVYWKVALPMYAKDVACLSVGALGMALTSDKAANTLNRGISKIKTRVRKLRRA